MGSLTYDGTTIGIDDRALTHLQIVIVNKLRRGESFLMSWKDSPEIGDGRSSVWMHPYMLLYFKFDGSRVPEIDGEWLADLSESADSSRGLIVMAEHGRLPRLDRKKRRGQLATVAVPASRPDAVIPDPK
jgi:hypothetical protein